jgi:ribonuclease P protein subunit RPR2
MDNKEIARERIKKLFSEAEEVFSKDKELANKYVKLARKIAMKFNLRMPRGYKRRFCKHCYSYLVPGKNVRIRTKNGKVVYYCLECKKFMRFPLSKGSK